MTTEAEFRAHIAAERQQAREAARAFVEGARDGDLQRLIWAVEQLDMTATWRPAIRALARSGQVHASIPTSFLQLWLDWGSHVRLEVGDDLVLARALRLLLPTYEGPGLTLYRGDSAWNRKRRTYGMSWTSDIGVGRSFAQGPWRYHTGGSVLLTATAPPEAIVCAPHALDDRYEEAEYIVDRRLLKAVQVVQRFDEAEIVPDRDRAA